MKSPSPGFRGPDGADSGENVGLTFAATLADQWARLGVRHAVVSPGSRSTPLALAVASHPDLTTHVHHDERSASFLALGIGLQSGVPAVLICTSGTAAAEFHAAVIEAHHANVPLLVATADRPPELQGVGAPQTIEQTNLFGNAVRWFVEPGPAAEESRGSWRYLATDAFRAATGLAVGRPPGPVHCNLAFREPLVGPLGELPPPIEIEPLTEARWGLVDEERAELVRAVSGIDGVIVCGDRSVREPGDAQAIAALAEALGWPMLSDPQSGLRHGDRGENSENDDSENSDDSDDSVMIGVDALLRSESVAQRLAPRFVIRIGGLLTSKVMNQWLIASGAPQVGLDRWGIIPDPERVLTRRFTCDVAEFCRQLVPHVRSADPAWLAGWRALSSTAAAQIAGQATGEIAVARTVLDSLPATGNLVVSSSMPVRDLEWFGGATGGTAVYSNRGANGIDGVSSTAVGVALASGEPTVCLIGDVAFLHDTNALLGLRARNAPLCIVVIDNDGGGIFSFLSQADALDHDRFEQLFGTPHGVHLLGLAGAHRIETADVKEHELAETLAEFVARPRPLVVRVASTRESNVAAHRRLNAAIAEAAGRVLDA
ncbi:MAG: 2-succinyl-5-enolpyruvyl-6-hydroxy-3-cyclohexene-1-carboxylic-acid synthase [Actinobacteria bacterium]|nr:2-succinyl-5-enolpyruvyl-6-hydroxy-3-cyclohexene-1-carboxylic-acid synthase [Actinomycetota bacterium]